MPASTPRQNLSTLNVRIDDHESRIDSLEVRLDRYDAIIVRLDTLIDVLTQHVQQISERADAAIEGQGLLKERNQGAHRWATIGIALASSCVVGILMFVIGYVLPH